ncbi:Cell cycle checkpoint protein RAD17 [Paramyrothecium foliicola]|nr:Cell cycle checkpoint protein RAD17 [Paramyrothecium foliicola]
MLSYVPVLNRLLGSSTRNTAIDISSVEVHNIETDPDRRARCLKHLLKANHVNYSIVYHNLQFDNHNPHILSSAYLLGASEKQLHDIYDAEIQQLEPWKPSPSEVVDEDWRDFLGDKRYQRAYVDYFEDKLAMQFSYSWKEEVAHFLFSGKQPLFHGLIGGLGHPLIHLGYAYEMDNKELAVEGLGLTAVQYNFFHKYLDNESYSQKSPLSTESPLDLLVKLSKDKRFESLPNDPALDDLESLFEKHEPLFMEYWNGWEINDPVRQFELSQEAAVAVFVSTVRPGSHSYNFFLVHLLTTSHAVRILLPFIPSKYHITLVREWWLLVIAIFVVKGRPLPDPDYTDIDVKDKRWPYVLDKALNSPWAHDAHYVKAIRAIKEAATTWGDVHESRVHEAAGSFVKSSPSTSTRTPIPQISKSAIPRCRRATEEGSDDEDELPRANTLANFLVSSPSSPSKTKPISASPSPDRRKSSFGQSSSTTASQRLPQRTQPQRNNTGTALSPKKKRETAVSDEKGKSADLKTLFSRQTQRAATTGVAKRAVEVDDPISDPISEDDEISELKASSRSLVSQHARKRVKNGASITAAAAPSATQRFLKPPRPPPSADGLDDDLRPWSERFGPRNLDELAVHKKKVADVRRWFEEVFAGRLRQRVLILKGAAGSGKTTTMRLLAKEMGYELLEWKNPTTSVGSGFVSVSAQFDEFLGRSGKFGALDVDGVSAPAQPPMSNPGEQNSRRIVMIEEFPNTFSRQSSTLTSFRASILNYIQSQVPALSKFERQNHAESIKPIVLLISETLLTTTSASADSFTAHRLLGPDILRHPGVGLIEFNAIAPSLLTKALELIVLKEARKSGRRKTPGPVVLKKLGEIGDIRSAVSSLEFLCLKGDQEADWGAKVAFTKQTRGSKEGIALTKGEEESLEQISQREASLGIFHAVGKVVYNKREDTAVDDPEENLPLYLSHCSRPKRSLVSVDSLIDETGTDMHTFISALHENYALSCESADPLDLSTPIDYLNECIEYLSQSDLLCPSRDVFFGGRGGFSGSDSSSQLLRQDEITFHVAVRGLLFSLPNPVKRKTSTMAKGSDAFKMFYPTSLKLWRAREELEGLVDGWSSKLLRGNTGLSGGSFTDGARAFRRPGTSGEQSWLQRQQLKPNAAAKKADDQREAQDTTPLLSLGSAARQELLLERLPYMTHIARARKSSKIRLRDLEKVVSFQGVSVVADDDDADDDTAQGEAWATDKPSEETSPRKKKVGIKAAGVSSMLSQKLVLSDDDIEDDDMEE